MTAKTAANTNRSMAAHDIRIAGFGPVAAAASDFHGGRVLATFTAHIKAMDATFIDLTLSHHDMNKFMVTVTAKTRMSQPMPITPGGSMERALAEAAGKAWNRLSVEDICYLRQLYASRAKVA
ncbi:hypothetical protein [Agrobacterium burrii]|uniref:Uncharacterized protein n=1 Tax=Agrobacterium burrii TaxID=2815339 RepID=A0ABS3EL90_9HYPH|nr:hypothetical protein [Agrobacterium burrii]MBO0132373.1 hypothetical protein [Agrobacterium burrii]